MKTEKIIPIEAPRSDAEGNPYVFVVLVQFAGGTVSSAYSAHRDREQADLVARAEGGRVMRVPYYDSVPRDPEQYPLGDEEQRR